MFCSDEGAATHTVPSMAAICASLLFVFYSHHIANTFLFVTKYTSAEYCACVCMCVCLAATVSIVLLVNADVHPLDI